MAKTKEHENAYQFVLDDSKINVLLMGVSGAGKSTLINAILGEEKALADTGAAVTKEIAPYENDVLPFRMIDTVGYEYGLFQQLKIKRELAKWSRSGIQKRDASKLIHIIWFCIDGQGKRVPRETLDYLHNTSKIWKGIPIIVVFTKSYSVTEVETNVQMLAKELEKYKKRNALNVQCTIPVVAREWQVDENTIIPPRGIVELVEKTNDLIPEAKRLNEKAVMDIDLKVRGAMANSVIAASTAAAAAIGAVPIPIADSALLLPLQSGMLLGVGKIYRMGDSEVGNEIIDAVIKVGGTTIAGKTLVSLLKAIPGVNIAAAVLNAIVAGTITFIAGEVSALVFDKTVRGEIDVKNVDWMKYITTLFNDKIPEYGKLLQSVLKKDNAESVLGNLAGILSSLIKK